MRTPAMAPCDRSRTTPLIDPVTSARAAYELKSNIKTTETARNTKRQRFPIGPLQGQLCAGYNVTNESGNQPLVSFYCFIFRFLTIQNLLPPSRGDETD